jgi:hypothetical protein
MKGEGSVAAAERLQQQKKNLSKRRRCQIMFVATQMKSFKECLLQPN